MKRLAFFPALLFAVATGTAAAAATHQYRIFGRHAAQYLQSVSNNSGAMYGTSCRLYDGNGKIGWAHAECVGNLNYRGSVYRFKNVLTPLGPRKCVEHITIPGEGHVTEYVKKAATFKALEIR